MANIVQERLEDTRPIARAAMRYEVVELEPGATLEEARMFLMSVQVGSERLPDGAKAATLLNAQLSMNSLHNHYIDRASQHNKGRPDHKSKLASLALAMNDGRTTWSSAATIARSADRSLDLTVVTFTPETEHPLLPKKSAAMYEVTALGGNETLSATVYTADGKPLQVFTDYVPHAPRPRSFHGALPNADKSALMRLQNGRFEDETELEELLGSIRNNHVDERSTGIEIEEVHFKLAELRRHAWDQKHFAKSAPRRLASPDITVIAQLQHLLR